MKLTLINPNIITQKGDFFGTGIPFMPITLAYTASFLRQNGHQIQVIDAFGENPKKILETKDFFIQGLSTEEIVNRINPENQLIILYASQVITHKANLRLLQMIKEKLKIPVMVIENIHSVVGYSLLKVHEEFLNSGADFIILSDPEERCLEIIKAFSQKRLPKTDGLIFSSNGKKIVRPVSNYPKDLERLPFPAWDLFPIKKYWSLAYSHAPMNKSYLPLLTSRGCPNNCDFCITPFLCGRVWRPRSPKNVAEEMEYYVRHFKVKEFHLEDFNPTVSKERIKELCQEILRKGLKVNLKIAAGTKAETIDNETISLMKKAGFSYISISPESGSPRMLEKMNKKFDHQHGIEIVRHMNKIGMISQACFIIGFPGETDKDLKLTRNYIKELVKAGIDEIAIFIMTPIPGSRACEYSPLGYKNLSHLTFSPKWRPAYEHLSCYRRWTYFWFLLWKLIYHPEKMVQHIYNLLTKNFNTKIEMALWRVVRMHLKSKMGNRW